MRDEKTHWADGLQTEIGSGRRWRYRVAKYRNDVIRITLELIERDQNGPQPDPAPGLTAHSQADARWIRDTLTEFIDDIHDIEALKDEIAQLRYDRDDIAGLRQALDAALGPHCSGCGNPIDPDVCHCGDVYDRHDERQDPPHSFCPMGCVCGYEPDWPQLARNLREIIWGLRREAYTMRPVFDAAVELHKIHAQAPQKPRYLDATGMLRAIDKWVQDELRLQHKASLQPAPVQCEACRLSLAQNDGVLCNEHRIL